MIPDHNLKANIDRFTGFGGLYDRNRPQAPLLVVKLLSDYAGGKPANVLDIGCGTGLSTFIWLGHADRITGVEPNEDMLATALEKWNRLGDSSQGIRFNQGYSNQLEIEDGAVDIVTCSQSFHWMEPFSTLKEISRVLRWGGVFAAYDCDWPPSVHWTVEDAYRKLVAKAEALIPKLPEEKTAVKRNKEEHLGHIEASGCFRYAREIVFHHMEACDAERYVSLALSQGGVQTALKQGVSLEEDIRTFREQAEAYFAGRTLDVMFGYRMRLGIK
jgi:ubiquinone/menaquinone biosynthesis C-methylase UbiE